MTEIKPVWSNGIPWCDHKNCVHFHGVTLEDPHNCRCGLSDGINPQYAPCLPAIRRLVDAAQQLHNCQSDECWCDEMGVEDGELLKCELCVIKAALPPEEGLIVKDHRAVNRQK